MNRSERWLKRHSAALIGNLVVFSCLLWVLPVLLLLSGVEPDGAPFACNLCLFIPLVNWFAAGMFFPIAIIADYVLERRLGWQRWRYCLVAAVASLVVALAILTLGGFVMTWLGYAGNWDGYLLFVIFYGGVPFVFGGPLYWMVSYVADPTVDDSSG